MKYDFQIKAFVETGVLPDKLAIAASDGDLSWAELKSRTEALARILKDLQIPAGHPVMIYGHKETLFPVAMLACIHCGIPYIPVDKIYPIERVQKILGIAGSQVLINCTAVPLELDIPVQIHPDFKCTKKARPDYRNRMYGSAADPLQYIMFTSGSTGEPKGVQITQGAVMAFLNWVIRDYGFGPDTVFMNQAPFTFDISLYDVLGGFALGASMVLNSTEVCREQEHFLKRIAHYGCTVWNSTPSFVFIYLRNPAFLSASLPLLKTFMLLGEELPQRTAAALKKQFDGARVINAYGPTEATVATTWVELTDELIQAYKSLPIGYAMPGAELLIEKASPSDKSGELIIAGDHVSAGYLKNDSLNAAKFFMHKGKRAFRTGDLAWEENGLFFFEGRNDDQVKMHGFRIELHEISSVLCRNTGIADAITLPLKRNGEIKKLVSFVILQNGLTAATLKQTLLPELESALPYYMVPGDLVALSHFPYSTSHKVDRNKLIEEYLIRQNAGG